MKLLSRMTTARTASTTNSPSRWLSPWPSLSGTVEDVGLRVQSGLVAGCGCNQAEAAKADATACQGDTLAQKS